MADNGIGASLVIPQAVLDKLDLADKKVKQLEESSSAASKAIVAAFSNAASGIDPFVSKLKEAKTALDGLKLKDGTFAAITEGAKAFNKELETTTKKASSVANEVSKVIQQSTSINAKPQKDINVELETQMRKYEMLKKAISEYNNLASTGSDTFAQKKQNEENIKLLNSTQALVAVLEKENATINANKNAFREAIAQVSGADIARQKSKATLEAMAHFYKVQANDYQITADIEARNEKERQKRIERKLKEEKAAARQAEKNAAAEAKALEKLNALREKARLGTFSGAMGMPENTINEKIAKVKQLKIARGDLNKEEGNYAGKLKELNAAMIRLNSKNAKAIAGNQKLQSTQRGLVDTSGQLARKLALMFSVSQVQGYIMNMVRVRGEFELQNTALQAILQNKEKADQLFNQITELAVKSPFQLKELVTYTKQLAAYRVETEKLYSTTKMLADISAGLGVGMDRLILAYGQVKAANYLRGTELRQFSEAGINILGELSKYFTELEGNVVSVGDVFERVSKRMVRFEDVEEVFKRLTKEGGIFYRMQEKQAETVSGKISNLRDSLDVMFNEIGKANDGAIKTSLSLIKSIVDNIDDVVSLLYAAGAAYIAYTGLVVKAAFANGLFASSMLKVTATEKGFVGFLARAALGVKSFVATVTASLKLTLIGAAISAIVYAIGKLKDKSDELEETREKYDSLSDSISRSKENMSKMVQTFKDSKAAMASAKSEMEKCKKGTEEYESALKTYNSQQRATNAVVEEMKAKFPAIYAGLKKQEDGTIDLAEAQEKLNEELALTSHLNFLAKDTEGFFSDGFITNVNDLKEKQDAYNKSVDTLGHLWIKASSDVSEFMRANNVSDELKKSFDEIVKSGDSTFDKVDKLYNLLDGEGFTGLRLRGVVRSLGTHFNKLKRDAKDLAIAQADVAANISNVGSAIVRTTDLSKEGAKEAMSRTLKVFLDGVGLMDGAVRDFVSKKFEVVVGVKVATDEDIDRYEGINKQIRDFVKSRGLDELEINVIRHDQSSSEYFKALGQDLQDAEEYVKRLTNATEQLNAESTNEEELIFQKKKIEGLKEIRKAYGFNESEARDKSSIAILKERISLIKKVNSEYESLLNNYDKEAAKLKVVESYKDAFKENGLGDIITSMDFDKQGTIAAIKDLSNIAGKEGAKEIEKSMADLKASVGLDLQISSQDKLSKEVDDLFSGYELSIELEKLDIPAEFSAQLAETFDLRYINLDNLQKEIERVKPMFENLGKEGVKAWESYEKKAIELQNKAIKERMSNYSSYLNKTVSERIKSELEAQKKIAEIPSQFSSAQKDSITKNILKEKQQQLDKIAWDDFKSTDLYIKMFEDIDFVSTATLKSIREKLADMKDSLKNLSPEQLKEITRQMIKIDEAMQERSPFSNLIPDIKEYVKLSRQRNNIEKEWIQSTAQENSLKDVYENQELIVAAKRKELNLSIQNTGLYSDQTNKAKDKLENEERVLDTILKELVAQGKISQEYADQISKTEGLQKRITKALSTIGSTFKDVSNGLAEMEEAFESITGTMSSKMKDVIDSAIEITNALGETAEGISRVVASGGTDIGGWIQSIVGVAKTVASIFNIGDKKRERQIKREIENVSRLEKAYQKLEEAISSAYDINILTASSKAAHENIKAQIASYKAMIAAEADKKKTDKDKIKEWEEKLTDLVALEKKLQEDITAQLGGFGSAENFKSASDEFVDAWLSAFRETGNGLEGLQDKFDEWLQQTVQKQMMLKLSNQYIKPILDSWDKMVSETSPGGVELTEAELKALKELMDKNAAEFDEAAKKYLEQLGLLGDFGGGGKELSGLSKGIQSVTETTAQALEALLNSMRFFVSDSNMQLKNIYNILFDNSGAVNPMLAELKLQTVQITSINKLLNSVLQAGHSKGGQGLKVFIS